MVFIKYSLGWWIMLGCLPLAAVAQVVPDRTLGEESSRVRRATVRNREADLIEGGARRGQNLFHSFREFGVREGDAVYFASPAAVENIFGRVTGRNPSNILGTLGVDGAANLYLMNPNGILFGPNASLDLGGSFVGTTASAIGFGEQQFSATDPAVPSRLLSVSPSAFFFNQVTAQPQITNQTNVGFGLRVPNGEILLLLGGDVIHDGGRLSAFGGRVEIGAVAGIGTVQLGQEGSLRFPSDLTRGNVSFTNRSVVDVASRDAGSIGITARNINLGNSLLAAGIATDVDTGNSQAGDISLNATNHVRVRQFSRIENDVAREAVGNAGNVRITARSLLVEDGSQISASTFGHGNAGNVVIDAGQVSFDDTNSVAFSDVGETGRGRGGNVIITADSLSITNGAGLTASTEGHGRAGNVIINAERVSFDGTSPDRQFRSAAFSRIEATGRGRGGNVIITADFLSLTDGARLSASTFGRGRAGNVVIDAGQVSFDRSSAVSRVRETGQGRGGNVTITADSLSLTNGAQIATSTFGRGRAGNVIINAGQASFDGTRGRFTSAAFSRVGENGQGRGGNVIITADSLSFTNGAQLVASTEGRGRAGNIVIGAGQVSFDGTSRDRQFPSAAFSRVEATGRGQGGSIIITADSLVLTNGAGLFASTFGRGRAGNVVIDARQVNFDGESAALSTVEETGRRRGGNITVTADSLSLTNGAQLVASTFGRGRAGSVAIEAGRATLNGSSADGFSSSIFSTAESTATGRSGDITITGNGLRLFNGGSIRTDDRRSGRVRGGGGDIRIDANYVLATNGSDILAFSNEGRGGNIDLPVLFTEGNVRVGETRLNRDQQNLLDQNNRIDIDASGQVRGGAVNVVTPDTSAIQNSLADLSENAIDPDALIASSCIARTETGGTFLITGTGGLPTNRPDALPPSAYPTDTVRTAPDAGWQPGDPIVEPQGVYQLPSGELVLSHDCRS